MKLGQLYNLEAIEKFTNSGEQVGFTDSQAGVVLARNLTAIDPRIFEKKYPELALLNSGIEIDNTGGYARQMNSKSPATMMTTKVKSACPPRIRP
jgi:hypothetical protein